MKYGITNVVSSLERFIDISPDEFERLKQAKADCLKALRVEEKFDLVVEDYAEFEETLLHLTMRHMLFRHVDWSLLVDDVQTINRRLVNMLSACRLYIDQVKHEVSEKSGVQDNLKKAFSSVYDANLGYRVLDALRNHVQHRDLPVRALIYGPRDESNGAKPGEYVCVPLLKVDAIEEAGKFKASVLKELKAIGEKVDLRPLVRDYVAGIGSVHEKLRGWLDADTKESVRILKEAQDRFTGQFGGRTNCMAVVARDDHSAIESFHIFDGFMKRRKRLMMKNMSQATYRDHFVSGEANQPVAS